MSGSPVDAVLLFLMVTFFAREQRRRPELDFRYWLGGWILVIVSMICFWVLPHAPGWRTLLECLRQNSLVCGAIAFIFASLVKERGWRAPMATTAAIVLPACAGLDLIVVGRGYLVLLLPLILAGEVSSAMAAIRLLSGKGIWTARTVLVICILSGGLMVTAMLTGHPGDLLNVVLAQLFLTSGVLFARAGGEGGQWLSGIGFAAWGLGFLLVSDMLGLQAAPMVFQVWMIPKYLVAFGMIVRIFRRAQTEIVCLSARYKLLYDESHVLFKSNPHPMWVYEMDSRRFLSVNDAAVKAYGFSEVQFLAMTVLDLVPQPEDVEGFAAAADLPGMKKATLHRRADGTVFDVDVTDHTISFEGREARFVLAVDITEREDLNRKLIHRAHHDVLTGLPNRMMLEDRLGLWLTRCIREEKKGALLTIDIDFFKRVNDTYGHMVGDECLKVVAERLSSRVRQVDTIARTGGEEFTIIIGGLAGRDGAEKVSAMLLALFDLPILAAGNVLPISISIGVALYPDDGVEVESLRRRSDEALYAAKRAGRRRVVFASEVGESAAEAVVKDQLSFTLEKA